MRYRTTEQTDWHDGRELVIVPAGEIVDVVRPQDIPIEERWGIPEGISRYAEQDRTFVAIKIRNWFGIIERKMLELVTTVPAPQSSKAPARAPRATSAQRGNAVGTR